MSMNTVVIDSLTKCRFDMGSFACFSFDKVIIAIGFAGLLLLILGIIMRHSPKSEPQESKDTHTKIKNELEGDYVKNPNVKSKEETK